LIETGEQKINLQYSNSGKTPAATIKSLTLHPVVNAVAELLGYRLGIGCK